MLTERPVITRDMALAWEAFWGLQGSRDPFGGRLPIGAIREWLDLNQIRDPETRQETVLLLQVLDDELQALKPKTRKGGKA